MCWLPSFAVFCWCSQLFTLLQAVTAASRAQHVGFLAMLSMLVLTRCFLRAECQGQPSILASRSCCTCQRSQPSTMLQAATAASTAQYVGFSAMLFMLVRQGRLDLRDLGSMPSMAEVVPFAKVSARPF